MNNIPKKMPEFDDLPDEIIVEIFSYLELKDLAYTVPKVSSYWKELSQDQAVWKDRTFKPQECMKDEQTIDFLRNMPALKSFSGWYWPEKNIDSIMNTLCISCKDLESLHLSGGSEVPYPLMEKLITTFPGMKQLNIPILKKDEPMEHAQLICKLERLTHLRFSDRYAEATKGLLRLIADGCPSLRHLDLNDNTFADDDIRYFLEKKHKQLISFKIWCPMTLATFDRLLQCRNLEEVAFNTYRYTSSLTEDDFLSLQKLKNLKTLELGYLTECLSKTVPDLFKGHSLSNVVDLRLWYLGGFNESHLIQVIMNCPQLMHFTCLLPNVKFDEGLKNIGNCRNLKSLNLGESPYVTAKCLDYVAAGCPNLNSLNLSCSLDIPDDVWLSVIKIKTLRVINISYGGFTGLYFDLFPTNLPNLREIVAYECGIPNETWKELRKEMPFLKITGLDEITDG